MDRVSETEFLNVDLDLYSTPVALAVLTKALQRRMFRLNPEPMGRATFELVGNARGPEETIRKILDAVEQLKPRARQAWNACARRELDIGIRAGDEPHGISYALAEQTLKRVARARLRLVLTLYGATTRRA
jgi:hypothetical protein